MKPMIKVLSFFFIFIAISTLAHAEETSSEPPQEGNVGTATSYPGGSGYKALYRQGSAPFSEKTTVTIQRVPDGYAVMGGGQTWTLDFKSIRGAISTPGGAWIYWFDGANSTLSAFFRMDQASADTLATELNDSVKAYWLNAQVSGNAMDEDQYKANYEQYKQTAIEQAK